MKKTLTLSCAAIIALDFSGCAQTSCEELRTCGGPIERSSNDASSDSATEDARLTDREHEPYGDSGSGTTTDGSGWPDTATDQDSNVREDTLPVVDAREAQATVDGGRDGESDGKDSSQDSAIDRLDASPEASDASLDAPREAAPPLVTLSVVAIGAAGVVASIPTGQVSCTSPTSGDCTEAYPVGSMVVLRAKPILGSDSYFAGWSGACSGINTTCAVTMDAAKTVTATFSAQPNNLVFVSSATYTPDKGSARAYDPFCNDLATAAGINAASGDGFVAWTSDSASDAIAQLGAARGFVLMDGRPFAVDQDALIARNAILHAIHIDETGKDVGSVAVMTATNPDGRVFNPSTYSATCNDWKGSSMNSDGVTTGSTSGGPVSWTNDSSLLCTKTGHIYCFQRTKTAALALQPASGKKIWVTKNPFIVGPSADPDTFCMTSRPTGVMAAHALISFSTAAAANALNSSTTYVRPDGIVVETGSNIVAAKLQSGIWQFEDGSYLSQSEAGEVATGAQSLTVNGSDVCGNWRDSSGRVLFGEAAFMDERFWHLGAATTICAAFARLYCVEE